MDYNNFNNQTMYQNNNQNKNSTLGIVSLILSIIGCTALIGFILSLIDLISKNGRKKTLSIIALVISSLWLLSGLFLIMLGANSDDNETKNKTTTTIKSTESKEEKDDITESTTESVKEEEIKDSYKVGETFTYKGVSVTYTEFGEYTDYDSYNAPPEGKKYVYAEFYIVNNSDSSQSYTFGDFNAYANDTNVEEFYGVELLSLTLSPGKYGSGMVAYEVPSDMQMSDFEIEFTYDYFNDKKTIFLGEGDGTPVIAEGADIEIAENTDIEMYSPGETYESKGISVEYVECGEFTNYSSYSAPKEGNKVIYFKFNFVNNSDDSEYISDWDFQCYADNKNFEEYYGMDESGFGLELSSGRNGSGTVAFEVPADAEIITVEYKDNYWTDHIVGFEYK